MGLDINHETNSQATGRAFYLLKSNLIKILKAGHGAEFTSLKRAMLLIEKGAAEWVSFDCIAFHDREFLPDRAHHTDSTIPLKFEFWPEPSGGFNVVQWHGGPDEKQTT